MRLPGRITQWYLRLRFLEQLSSVLVLKLPTLCLHFDPAGQPATSGGQYLQPSRIPACRNGSTARLDARAAIGPVQAAEGRERREERAGQRLVSETSVSTSAKHLIELIARGEHSKEQIVEACRLWLKLQSQLVPIATVAW
jgi:hypothetical protein